MEDKKIKLYRKCAAILIFFIKVTFSFQKSNYYLCTYDLNSPVHNVLDACISIMRRRGRGLGPGIREFLGPVKGTQ
jgi:hypothetical protein